MSSEDARCQSEPEVAQTDTGEHYPVQIKHAENGFIVSIGCKVFVSKDWLEVSSKLQEYWKNPRKAEEEFYK